MRPDRITVALLCLCLAACSNPVADAQSRVDFLEKNGGTLGEVCDAKRVLAKASADAQDASNYQMHRLSADIDCMRADQLGRDMPTNESDPAYSIEPDNLEALPDTVSRP